MDAETYIFRHCDDDMVGVAIRPIKSGSLVNVLDMKTHEKFSVRVKDDIPLFHKVALIDILQNADIIEYGQVIGKATELISVGEYVHVHNIKTKRW